MNTLEKSEELLTAYKELAFQNEEKEHRAAELRVANKELLFQNQEKSNRAAELAIANIELIFQNGEKEKLTIELSVANKELLFQNVEKEKRAAELSIANIELLFQNKEKENRAAELAVANIELVFQNDEKEKRAAELIIANTELEQFAYIASHDLQEPLRTISNYMLIFEEDYAQALDEKAYRYLRSVDKAVKRMSVLIKSLLDFSRLNQEKTLAFADCNIILSEVEADLNTLIKKSGALIKSTNLPSINVYETDLRQVFQNLISNAIKFKHKDKQPVINISAEWLNDAWQFAFSDNGIGIAPHHFDRVFEIFRRLHSPQEYEGNGIGLANCKKIIQLHKGKIWVESILGQGSTFYFTIPILTDEQ